MFLLLKSKQLDRVFGTAIETVPCRTRICKSEAGDPIAGDRLFSAWLCRSSRYVPLVDRPEIGKVRETRCNAGRKREGAARNRREYEKAWRAGGKERQGERRTRNSFSRGVWELISGRIPTGESVTTWSHRCCKRRTREHSRRLDNAREFRYRPPSPPPPPPPTDVFERSLRIAM